MGWVGLSAENGPMSMSDLSSYNLFNLFKNDKLTFLIKIALVYHSSLSCRFSRSLVLLDTSQTLKKVKL